MSSVPTGLDKEILQLIGKAAGSVPLEDFNIHHGEFTVYNLYSPRSRVGAVDITVLETAG